MFRTPERGETNSLCDVPGLKVGHASRRGDGWLTGTTVVLPEHPEGAVTGVDVRGGGPGTRETDALDPWTLVTRSHAVVLSGGSAFGLAAADGVMRALRADGRGLSMGPGRTDVVPIVPAAVIFDLGRGGDFGCYPDAEFGVEAYRAARDGSSSVAFGSVGAGMGAQSGGLKGGLGSASTVMRGGFTIAALAVVNSVGLAFDPLSGELYAARYAQAAEYGDLRVASKAEVDAAAHRRQHRGRAPGVPSRSLNTTIGVVATDAPLVQVQCGKLAAIGHDGMARGIKPVHTMFDGDTIFGISTGEGEPLEVDAFQELLECADDVFTRAIGHAILGATSVNMPGGASLLSYRDAFPSVFQ